MAAPFTTPKLSLSFTAPKLSLPFTSPQLSLPFTTPKLSLAVERAFIEMLTSLTDVSSTTSKIGLWVIPFLVVLILWDYSQKYNTNIVGVHQKSNTSLGYDFKQDLGMLPQERHSTSEITPKLVKKYTTQWRESCHRSAIFQFQNCHYTKPDTWM